MGGIAFKTKKKTFLCHNNSICVIYGVLTHLLDESKLPELLKILAQIRKNFFSLFNFRLILDPFFSKAAFLSELFCVEE